MATSKWIIDPTHSELSFKIKHLMISNVTGYFSDFSVDATTKDDDFSTAKIKAVIKIGSIQTKNAQRDEHLRTSDFFEAEKYPEAIFESSSIEKVDDENYRVHGNLTLKGVTKPTTLNVEYGHVAKDPWGGERAGFVISGKIKRTDFGVSVNTVLETGGLALGDEVKINSELQLVKQAEAVVA